MPNNEVRLASGMPNSAKVGRSGAVGRRAGNDAVEIFRVPLRSHQALDHRRAFAVGRKLGDVDERSAEAIDLSKVEIPSEIAAVVEGEVEPGVVAKKPVRAKKVAVKAE